MSFIINHLIPIITYTFTSCFDRRVDGSLEYSFQKTLVSWLGREVTNSLSFSFFNANTASYDRHILILITWTTLMLMTQ